MANENGDISVAPRKSAASRKAAAPKKPVATRKRAAPVGDILADQLTRGNASVKDSAKETIASLKAAAGSAKHAASAAATQAKDAAAAAASQARETGEAWREQAGTLAEQALETAKSAATTAKGKTGSALHSLSRLIADTAETVDSRMGPQYGDYARKAAESVAGTARSLDEKDVDELVADARNFVRKSPAVALGAAALVGFVVMRLARGGSSKDS